MADQLQSIVQRMIDAGESEDNIATVIQHFKAQQPEPATLIGSKGRVTSDTTDAGAREPDTWWGGFTKSLGDQAREMFVDNPITQGAAHPQSLEDFAALLAPETPAAVTRTIGKAVRPVVAPALRTTASALEAADSAKAALKYVIPGANPAKNLIPFEAAAGRLRTLAQTAQDANMGIARGADMYEMSRFPRSTESTARVPMAHGEPGITAPVRSDGLPMMRQADVVPQAAPSLRERFPNGLPIEPAPSHVVSPEMVPVGDEAVYNAAHAAAPAAQAEAPLLPKDQILRDMRDPEMVQRAKDMQERAQAAPRLQRDRMNVGAEKVGRVQGMTTADVRTQAGPVLGEAVGEASPVFPQGPFDRMAETLKALKPEDRLAYVMKAGDVKTQAQLETIRRVMAKYGLVIPAAATIAPTVRDMLLQRMRAGVTGEP